MRMTSQGRHPKGHRCHRSALASLLACMVMGGVCPAYGDEQAELQELAEEGKEGKYLLPSLGREWLEDQGVDLKFLAVNDNWANVRGGNERGVGSMGNLNVILTLDTEKAGWWEHGSFTLYGIWIYGQRPSQAVGDYQFTSSIDAPVPQLEPYEAFYEHTFLDGRLKWLAGIHDFTLDFAILDYGFTFINSSFYTPSTITQMPYSFYPNTSWGTRAIYDVTDKAYAMLGFYDGQPATTNNIDKVDLQLSAEQGLYSIGEIGWKGDSPAGYYTKVAFGTWYCTGNFTDLGGQEFNSNFGTYLLGEQELWKELEHGDEGLGAFFQVGQAEADRNINPWYFGAGLRYQGLLPNRGQDVLGFGLAMATFGSLAREVYPGIEGSERTFELSYRAPMNAWLTLTPDAQFVVDPSGNPSLDNDLIFYIRSEISL